MSNDVSARPSVFQIVPIANTATPLVGSNDDRTALTIVPVDADIFIGLDSGVTVTTGLRVPAGTQPFIACQCHLGDFVKRQLFAICAAGTHNVAVVQGFEPVREGGA